MPASQGVGVVGVALGLIPDPDESMAAREASRILRRPERETFAELSELAGAPTYWLGQLPLTVADLARLSKASALEAAVARFRPRRPGESHALVFASPGVGLQVLTTWSPSVEDRPKLPQATYAFGLTVRGRAYTLGSLDDLARLPCP